MPPLFRNNLTTEWKIKHALFFLRGDRKGCSVEFRRSPVAVVKQQGCRRAPRAPEQGWRAPAAFRAFRVSTRAADAF